MVKKIRFSAIFIAVCLLTLTSCTQVVTPDPAPYKVSSYGLSSEPQPGSTYTYFLFSPDVYSDQLYPLVIFLHGAGERSTTLTTAVLVHGPLKALYSSSASLAQTTEITPLEFGNLNSHIRGSFVLAPQVPANGWWDTTKLKNLVDGIVAGNPRIDQHRIYVTGLSMGGGGCWDFTRKYPALVAAAIPICGASSTGSAAFLSIPIWTFQAFNDTTVAPVTSTIKILNDSIPGTEDVMTGYPNVGGDLAVAAASDQTRLWTSATGFSAWSTGIFPPQGNISFTFYRTGGHDSWTRTYANADVWDWLFAQRKP